jgi:hypothetical protein
LGTPIPDDVPLLLAARDELEREDLASMPSEYTALGLLFDRYVRDVSGVTLDGDPVTTGAQLFDVVDESLLVFILHGLCENVLATRRDAS